MFPAHPRLKLWLDIGALLAEVSAVTVKQIAKSAKPRRRGSFLTRRPGADTPFWNVCAARLRDELRPHGAKVRLARYLGIPKQRLTEYLKDGSRMPDTETALQMLNWLAHKNAGQDLSL